MSRGPKLWRFLGWSCELCLLWLCCGGGGGAEAGTPPPRSGFCWQKCRGPPEPPVRASFSPGQAPFAQWGPLPLGLCRRRPVALAGVEELAVAVRVCVCVCHRPLKEPHMHVSFPSSLQLPARVARAPTVTPTVTTRPGLWGQSEQSSSAGGGVWRVAQPRSPAPVSRGALGGVHRCAVRCPKQYVKLSPGRLGERDLVLGGGLNNEAGVGQPSGPEPSASAVTGACHAWLGIEGRQLLARRGQKWVGRTPARPEPRKRQTALPGCALRGGGTSEGVRPEGTILGRVSLKPGSISPVSAELPAGDRGPGEGWPCWPGFRRLPQLGGGAHNVIQKACFLMQRRGNDTQVSSCLGCSPWRDEAGLGLIQHGGSASPWCSGAEGLEVAAASAEPGGGGLVKW